MNTQCSSSTLDPLSQKFEDENVSLEFQVMSLEKENDLCISNLSRATSTKSWLCHQRKSKKSPHKPKPIPNSKNRLHLLHMDLCGPIRLESINGKRYVIEIVDDYSRDTWVHFLRSIDEAPKNDHEDIGKLGAKGDVGFFLAMDFEQRISKPELQGRTSGQISSELDLTYAPSAITSQNPTEHELELLFEAMYDDYIGGQPSDATITSLVNPKNHNLPTPNACTIIAKSAPPLTNSSSQTPTILNTSQDGDELQQQQHVQQQGDQAQLQSEVVADNVNNVLFDENMFINPFALPSISFVESSSQYVDPSNIHTFYQLYQHDYQWNKDHPLKQVIGEPSTTSFDKKSTTDRWKNVHLCIVRRHYGTKKCQRSYEQS
ncbi:retrovirus-related pol polyprotein from transposon TNT 1-94 [Tanacetum coccineum]